MTHEKSLYLFIDDEFFRLKRRRKSFQIIKLMDCRLDMTE
jgi:hypothetical protein